MHQRRISWWATWLASLGMILPVAPARAQTPAPRAPESDSAPNVAVINDVSLTDGGSLVGMVVDAQGLPMPGTDVTLLQSAKVVSRATADSFGNFKTEPLRGGVYQVVAGEGGGTLRVWEAKAAPPSARPVALVVGSSQVVRGQVPFRRAFFSDAFVLAAIIAAAIAIPVAISAARNPEPSSS